uniref:Uncharacterized protein n=1 Tax=Anguilla anguilla TaxID=7936 RepID=A0A0E9XIE9_ANGAN
MTAICKMSLLCFTFSTDRQVEDTMWSFHAGFQCTLAEPSHKK